MTHTIRAQAIRPNVLRRLRVAGWMHASCLAALYCGRAVAQGQQNPPIDEVDVSVERQNALQNEVLTISDTPDAGPHLHHTTAIVGIGAVIHPLSTTGSNKDKVAPFPYVDIRGLLDDRVFVSDIAGLGVKVLNEGLVRAGVSVNYGGERKSSDDPRLKGLPNVQAAPEVIEYAALVLSPITLETKVEQRVGKGSGMTGTFGASYNFAPLPLLHVSLSAAIGWATAQSLKTEFGITAADAAATAAQGNPLPVYTPGSGVTAVQLAAVGVYQISRRWGLIGRIDFTDLVGASVRDSPLVHRTSIPGFAFGIAYMF